MKTRISFRVLYVLLYLLAVNASYADDEQAHEHAHDHDHDHTHDHEPSRQVLAFRLVDWKERSFTDPDRAERHLEALQKLRCEARLGVVDGVSTLSYRCEDWNRLTFTNQERAEQWEAWLDAAGFETSSGQIDPELLEGSEVVEFRLTEWRTASTGDEGMEDVAKWLLMIGCEVEQTEDGDHVEVHYRSPLWSDIRLPDHETAHDWASWLEEQGFEVQYAHGAAHGHDHD